MTVSFLIVTSLCIETLLSQEDHRTYFDVKIPYDGDLTLIIDLDPISTLSGIIAFDYGHPTNPIIAQSTSNKIFIPNLQEDTYITFSIEGVPDTVHIERTVFIKDSPTNSPTPSPTKSPTIEPTLEPTIHPTLTPTTPSPTNPGLVTCGVPVTGDFNAKELVFGINVPYETDLIFSIYGIIPIYSISAYTLHSNAEIAKSKTPTLIVPDALPDSHIIFVVEGIRKGTFNAIIDCKSVIQCGDTTNGRFNNDGPQQRQTHIFRVKMTHDGDMEFYITGMNVYNIKAYHPLNPNVIIAETPLSGVNSLTVFNLKTNDKIIFKVAGTGIFNETFDVRTHCKSAAPTLVPTPAPTTISHKINCNSRIGGVYHTEWNPLNMDVNIPFDGDMTFFITGVSVMSIKAYNLLNPLNVLSKTPMVGINSLSLSQLTADSNIMFEVEIIEGTGQNTPFNAMVECVPSNNNNNNGHGALRGPKAAQTELMNVIDAHRQMNDDGALGDMNLESNSDDTMMLVAYLSIILSIFAIMICCCTCYFENYSKKMFDRHTAMDYED